MSEAPWGRELAAIESRIADLRGELHDLVKLRTRLLGNDSARTSLDEVLAMHGYTREQIAKMPDSD